jgi:hypothetical protein
MARAESCRHRDLEKENGRRSFDRIRNMLSA